MREGVRQRHAKKCKKRKTLKPGTAQPGGWGSGRARRGGAARAAAGDTRGVLICEERTLIGGISLLFRRPPRRRAARRIQACAVPARTRRQAHSGAGRGTAREIQMGQAGTDCFSLSVRQPRLAAPAHPSRHPRGVYVMRGASGGTREGAGGEIDDALRPRPFRNPKHQP